MIITWLTVGLILTLLECVLVFNFNKLALIGTRFSDSTIYNPITMSTKEAMMWTILSIIAGPVSLLAVIILLIDNIEIMRDLLK